MKVFLETSALAKRYVQELGSEELEDLFFSKLEEVHVSVLALPEFAAAVGRKVRNREIPHDSAAKIMEELEEDWQGAFIKIPLTDELANEAASLSLQYPLKGADAVHLISAAAAAVDLFVTSDDALLKVAEKIGLRSYNPASGLFRG